MQLSYLAVSKTTVFEREKAGALWIIPTAFSLANMLLYGTADNSRENTAIHPDQKRAWHESPLEREIPTQSERLAVDGKTWINSIGIEFVPIPAGVFTMGSPHSDLASADNEKPAHRVEISQPFYLGKHVVTQAQWEEVMGHNPSHFQGHPNRPVERVSWDEVQGFIDNLNTKEGNLTYRLPTEAEWEYACRAGTTTVYSFGDNPVSLSEYAWYSDNAEGMTHPVGQLQPNDWGLYDMHGNVWEWVQDWYSRDYYQQSPMRDPKGPDQGRGRVLRGGSWFNIARSMRSAQRTAYAPDYSNFIGSIGFRCSSSCPSK